MELPHHESPAKPPGRANPTPRQGLFLWAVVGVTALLVQAMARLGTIAWEGLTSGQMTAGQYALCAGWVVMNGYLEGYRGFQKKFVPRVLARAHHLASHPQPLSTVLAPLYAMAFFRATTRAKGAAWGVTMLVVLAIFAVRALPQPWRGIIDAGVVVGLGWGTLVLVAGAVARLTGAPPSADPEVEDELPAPSLNGA